MAGQSRRVRRQAPERRWPKVVVGLVITLVVGAGAVLTVTRLTATHSTSSSITPRCTAVTDAGSAALSPEQAANAALIAAVGASRQLNPRAVTIALATAMQESKLRNLDYGDRDSLGMFQQRPSQDWGTPEQVMDPLYAANKFYEVLETIANYEALPITEAAQAVQRSAYPDAYAQHEPMARSFASALTGNSPGSMTCRLRASEQSGSGPEFIETFQTEWKANGATLTRERSATPSPEAKDSGAQVTIATDSPVRAWAVAEWSVAKAQQLSVQVVEVSGQVWDRQTGTWTQADGSAASSPNLVIVTLA